MDVGLPQDISSCGVARAFSFLFPSTLPDSGPYLIKTILITRCLHTEAYSQHSSHELRPTLQL